MRSFAGRLIAHETAAKQPSRTTTPAAFLVCARLRPHLATLMGSVGFVALLSRALALAKAEVPWLRSLNVDSDGSFAGLEEADAQAGADERSRGGAVVLAHLLGLLVTFVGEDLTLHLVREVWPKLPPDILDADAGTEHEKLK